MKAIEAPRGLLSSTEDLSDSMMKEIETCNGQIGWLGGNGRPGVAAGHSIIASKVKYRHPELVKLGNVCVKQAQSHSIKMKVWPIKPKDLRMVVFADSAFDLQGIRHQQGWIIGFTNTFLNANERARQFRNVDGDLGSFHAKRDHPP